MVAFSRTQEDTFSNHLCGDVPVRQLTTPLCLIFTLLLFSATSVWSADWNKGADAYDKGDYATALREWEPLAKQGHAAAQYMLGVMYYEGRGVLQDYKIAGKWYRKAAEQGAVKALEKINPHARPNKSMVWFANEILERDMNLYKTAHDMVWLTN